MRARYTRFLTVALVRDPKLHAAIRKMRDRLTRMPWTGDHYEWVALDRKVTLRTDVEPSYEAFIYILNGDGWTAKWQCQSHMNEINIPHDPITFEGDRQRFEHDCVLIALDAE